MNHEEAVAGREWQPQGHYELVKESLIVELLRDSEDSNRKHHSSLMIMKGPTTSENAVIHETVNVIATDFRLPGKGEYLLRLPATSLEEAARCLREVVAKRSNHVTPSLRKPGDVS